MAVPKRMDRAEYQNELLRLAQAFVQADQDRAAAEHQMREAEGRKAGVAGQIRRLAPSTGPEFIRALDSPPWLCDGCGQPSSYLTDRCYPCQQKALIEERAREIAGSMRGPVILDGEVVIPGPST